MATGAPGTNGVWQYGEDDSEATFSALLNKAAATTNTQLGLDRARLTTLEQAGRIVTSAMASYDVITTTTSTAGFVSTGLSVTITPKYSNSDIYVMASSVIEIVSLSNSFTGAFRISTNSGATQLAGGHARLQAAQGAGGTLAETRRESIYALHTPGSTSPVTYRVDMLFLSGLRFTAQPDNGLSLIIAFEVKK